MKTLEDVLDIMGARIDHSTLKDYIAREWVRPAYDQTQLWHFEEIDIARLQLVCHLAQDIQVNDEGMDIVLSLLDQLYGLRAQMKNLSEAIAQQPSEIQERILAYIRT